MTTKKADGETSATFIVLGVFQREVTLILSTEDGETAREAAEAGVLQSKFSQTFVLEPLHAFSEAKVPWANPDGVKHEPAQGAALNPGAGDQEPPAEDKKTDLEVTSKREQGDIAADAQKDTRVDTGKNPDMTPSSAPSESKAKSGVQSSSDLKGTTNAETK